MFTREVAYMLDEYFVSNNKAVKFTEDNLLNSNGKAKDTLCGARNMDLSYGETYYMPRIVNNDISYESHIWHGSRKDIMYFDNFMVCITKENAIQKAKTLRDIGGIDNLSFGGRIEK